MITISGFTHRLGNQLFQIAAAYTLAKKNNTEFLIPKWEYEKYFDFKFNHYSGEPIEKYFSENGFHFNEIPFQENMSLSGYFQSHKYFDKEIVNEIFKTYRRYSDPKEWNICAIHVRRGDYLSLPKHHPICPEWYYRKAIEMMMERKVSDFVIFSDDIEWCKSFFTRENFGFEENLNFDYTLCDNEDQIPNDLSDLLDMAACKYNIIANSTFSWWVAYLNNHKDKVIISPSKDNWHGPAYANWNHDDLLPEEWIQIKY